MKILERLKWANKIQEGVWTFELGLVWVEVGPFFHNKLCNCWSGSQDHKTLAEFLYFGQLKCKMFNERQFQTPEKYRSKVKPTSATVSWYTLKRSITGFECILSLIFIVTIIILIFIRLSYQNFNFMLSQFCISMVFFELFPFIWKQDIFIFWTTNLKEFYFDFSYLIINTNLNHYWNL